MTQQRQHERERAQRRDALHKGMVACYEVIDRCRKELAELEAAETQKPPATTKGDGR